MQMLVSRDSVMKRFKDLNEMAIKNTVQTVRRNPPTCGINKKLKRSIQYSLVLVYVVG